jgi:protein-tyrosine phosphatase
MGSSRSAILVIYYLIKKYQMSMDEALHFLKEKRSIVNINNNFIKDVKKCL